MLLAGLGIIATGLAIGVTLVYASGGGVSLGADESGLKGTLITEGCDYHLEPAPPMEFDGIEYGVFELHIYNRNTGAEQVVSTECMRVWPWLVTSTGQLAYVDFPHATSGIPVDDYDMELDPDDNSPWHITEGILRNAYCDQVTETATLFSSIGDSTQFDSESGLIIQSTFGLKWNSPERQDLWDPTTVAQYKKFESGELSGTRTPMGDVITLNGTTVNRYYALYYALNAGQDQKDPVVTNASSMDELSAGAGTAAVAYGSVEESAIKARYKRYDKSAYNVGLKFMIDSIVQQVVDASIKTRSQYNFRKIDSNVHFREENTTIFAGDETTTEMESDVATATTTMTTTSTSTGGY